MRALRILVAHCIAQFCVGVLFGVGFAFIVALPDKGLAGLGDVATLAVSMFAGLLLAVYGLLLVAAAPGTILVVLNTRRSGQRRPTRVAIGLGINALVIWLLLAPFVTGIDWPVGDGASRLAPFLAWSAVVLGLSLVAALSGAAGGLVFWLVGLANRGPAIPPGPGASLPDEALGRRQT